MIEVVGISKRYGKHVALEQLDLTLAVGEVVALVGRNGAGKTTALRCIVGYVEPDRGVVRVDGHSMALERETCQRTIGYAAESGAIYGDMRVADYLGYRARLKGLSRAAARSAVERVAGEVELVPRMSWRCGALSRGLRQRVALADSLLANPPYLILDEPSTGLDPEQQARLQELLAELRRSRAIIIATHSLAWIEPLATRFLFIDRGRSVASGQLAELRAQLELPADCDAARVFDSVIAGTAR